jgi:hypothetical protein
MYKDNLVVIIKHNNKVLRERGDKVTLPFGSEYSILVKNLNSRKVSVNISIDGEDVLDKKSILIEANSSMELDGFMKGMSAKNRFRFIKKTKQISEYRGDKVDDGFICVEFAYEKVNNRFHCEPIKYTFNTYRDTGGDFSDSTVYRNGDSIFTACSDDGHTGRGGFKGHSGFSSRKLGCSSDVSLAAAIDIPPEIDDGITVKGEEINQGFVYGHIGELESSQVMVIHLCGEKINGTVVSKPVTVKTRLRCKTCGNLSKSNAKFCSNCGTFLE